MLTRPSGGIEPLCRQTATGLKPAPRTTEDQLGSTIYLQLNIIIQTSL